MWSKQCNVEFRCQVRIWSRLEGNHGRPWWSWPVAGPSGCKLTSSQQSSITHANPNVSPYLLLLCLKRKRTYLFLHLFRFMCVLWMSTKQLCTTFAKIMHAHSAHTCVQTYIYLYLWLFAYWWVLISVRGGGGRMLHEASCSSSNRGFYVTVHSTSPLLLSAILSSVGNWSISPSIDWKFWDAFL
jgi:hypothetical protein